MGFPVWLIGCALSIGANIAINLGMTVMKRSHAVNNLLPAAQQKAYFARPLWLLGFAVFMVGEVLNFASMSFASQTLLAVLGCFSPLSNVFIAPWLLKEPVRRADILSLPLIIGGSVIVVFFSDHSPQDYTLDELVTLYRQPVFVGFALLLLALLLGSITYVHGFHRLLYHTLCTKRQRRKEDVALTSLLSPTGTSAPLRQHRYGSASSMHSDHIPIGNSGGADAAAAWDDRVGIPIGEVVDEDGIAHPAEHFCCCACCDQYRVRSPMVCTLIGSILGGVGFMFARSFSLLIKESMQGSNQFKKPMCIFIVLVFAASGVGRIHYINEALNDGQAMLVVPSYYVLSTVLVIAGGLTYFKEYQFITSAGVGIAFAGGVSMTLLGVVIIAFFGAGREDIEADTSTSNADPTGVVTPVTPSTPGITRTDSWGSRRHLHPDVLAHVDGPASAQSASLAPDGRALTHNPLQPPGLTIRVPSGSGYATFHDGDTPPHGQGATPGRRNSVDSTGFESMVAWLGTPVAAGAPVSRQASMDVFRPRQPLSRHDRTSVGSPSMRPRRQGSGLSVTSLTTPLW